MDRERILSARLHHPRLCPENRMINSDFFNLQLCRVQSIERSFDDSRIDEHARLAREFIERYEIYRRHVRSSAMNPFIDTSWSVQKDIPEPYHRTIESCLRAKKWGTTETRVTRWHLKLAFFSESYSDFELNTRSIYDPLIRILESCGTFSEDKTGIEVDVRILVPYYQKH